MPRDREQTGTPLMNRVRAALAKTRRLAVFRNSCGYDAEHRQPYGLGKGSADLVGFLIGSGRFVAFEVKSGSGRPTKQQSLWLAFVRKCGGFACVVRSPEDALAALERASQGLSE